MINLFNGRIVEGWAMKMGRYVYKIVKFKQGIGVKVILILTAFNIYEIIINCYSLV